MRVLFIPADITSCNYVRAFLPCVYLGRQDGFETEEVVNVTREKLAWADIVIYARQGTEEALHNLGILKRVGKRVIYDVDDDLFNIHETNVGAKEYYTPERLKIVRATMEGCDAMTVSTEYLAKRMQTINPRVYVLKNCVDVADLARLGPSGHRDGEVRIGWQGGSSHWWDLAVLGRVLPAIARRHPETRFVFMGGFETDLFAGIPAHRKEYYSVGFPKFYYGLHALDIDIGLAPLAKTLFNASKSNWKFLDYSVFGVPTVATFIECYRHDIINGETGFLCRTEDEWIDTLSMLVEDEDLRRRVGMQARQYALEHYDIAKNISRWMDVYREVVNNGA